MLDVSRTGTPAENSSIAALIASCAEPLREFDDSDFGSLFDRFGGKRIVLLGEASHGTSEFYRARAAITRRLIERHGFSIVAVEADWPDAAVVDRHVRHKPARPSPEPPFPPFPTWMWAHIEGESFISLLRQPHQAGRGPAR